MKLIKIDKIRRHKNKQCICKACGKQLADGEPAYSRNQPSRTKYYCLKCGNKNMLLYQVTRTFLPHSRFSKNSSTTQKTGEVKTQNV